MSAVRSLNAVARVVESEVTICYPVNWGSALASGVVAYARRGSEVGGARLRVQEQGVHNSSICATITILVDGVREKATTLVGSHWSVVQVQSGESGVRAVAAPLEVGKIDKVNS